jgi:hypothetical protein
LDEICRNCCGAALAGGLVEDNGSGGRDVEGADTASHGNPQKMITGAANEIVEAGPLAAEDDDKVAGEVELVVVGLTTLVEPDDPEIVLLEIFKRADEVDDASDAEVFGCTGTGFDGHGTEGCGATLGEDDTIDSGAVGNAQKRTQILRIFDTIEGEDQTGIRSGRRGLEEVFNGEKFLRTDERDNALMGGSFGSKTQLIARLLANANAGLAALFDEALDPLVLALAGDENVVEAAAASLESFFNCVQAVENFHKVSLRE